MALPTLRATARLTKRAQQNKKSRKSRTSTSSEIDMTYNHRIVIVGLLCGCGTFAVKNTTLTSLVLCWLVSAGSLAAAEREPQVGTLQPGVRLSLVAEHPGLATPTGIDVDDHGRVWVVATHTHFRPDDYLGPKHDEILIFSDRDGDGRAEQRQVFYNATEATVCSR